jgi:inhibitor of cysteine peptidase
MKRIMIIFSLGICCLCAVAFAGCVSGPVNPAPSPTPVGTAIPVGNLVVNETQNNATVYMNKGTIITVKLAENPTTGFQWNLTTTPGLRIVKDEYIPDDPSGNLVGSGGTHVWDISTEITGDQEIQAEYTRSWERISVNESLFSMTVVVS